MDKANTDYKGLDFFYQWAFKRIFIEKRQKLLWSKMMSCRPGYGMSWRAGMALKLEMLRYVSG